MDVLNVKQVNMIKEIKALLPPIIVAMFIIMFISLYLDIYYEAQNEKVKDTLLLHDLVKVEKKLGN